SCHPVYGNAWLLSIQRRRWLRCLVRSRETTDLRKRPRPYRALTKYPRDDGAVRYATMKSFAYLGPEGTITEAALQRVTEARRATKLAAGSVITALNHVPSSEYNAARA